MPVAVLGPGDTVVTKRDTAPVLMTIMGYMYAIQYSNAQPHMAFIFKLK